MEIRAVIIDDEEGARESLANLIEKFCPQVKLCGKAENAIEGRAKIAEVNPDLIFLDIEMPVENAFDMLSKIENIDFDIIFTTAYDHYAINAIKFSALDYLLKPIDIDELRAAVEKVSVSKSDDSGVKLQALLDNIGGNSKQQKIAIPETDGLLIVKVDEIVHCESDSNYTHIFMNDGKKILASRTLGEFEDMLSGHKFFRTHRSHLINMEHIVKYIKGEGGYVTLSNGSQIEVSRRKKTEFLEVLASL